MVSISEKFDQNAYNALLPISDATKAFEAAGGKALLNGHLQDVIKRHDGFGRWGIRLLHAPFEVGGDSEGKSGTTELKKGFRYVNFGNVAFPAEVGRLAPKEKTKFVPTTWLFGQATGRGNRDVTALPVELSYSPSPVQDQLSQADLDLLDDLQKVLVEKNLTNVLGVELVYPSVPGIKFKRGPNVITLPAEFRDVVPGTESYPTLWVFHPKNGVTVQCVEIGGPIGEFFFDDEF